MSELSYLEKLLDGAEVEWKTLEKVLKRTKGTKITAGQMKALHKDNAPLKIFAGGKTVAFVDFKDIPEKDINREPSIIVKSRGIIEFEYYDKPFSHKNEMWSYHSNNDAISIKYIYYFLKINEGYFQKIGGKMQMPQIATPDTDKFEVPIPCPDNPEKSLAIQSEIVRILDIFTALTAELTAELTMRKKQYNYYRDQLLSFDEGEVEWKTLGAIGKFTYGYAAKAQISGDARFVRITDINTNGKLSPFEPMFVDISAENEKYTLKKNDLLMARTGATFGKTMIFEEDYPAIYAGFLIKLSLDRDIIDPKYYWHFAQSDYFWEQANKLVSGGGQPQFNANALKQIKVPIPYPNEAGKSLSEQARIVSVLDKFDILASSITEGLPREIELRQKQYEYYRDLLFSFPKPEIASH
ncbi:restriction endonuclease subunit S (plasmid) [Klebsiella pneumoniae]|uniref:restriction endonuclease subunit S n=1 Tax=Klebsiella pneumoniae TaxID=573 RepID=UPI0013310C35|nr:restriction endonuclease subunit S [Klebsiella pneumoniae]WPG80360.1 restriction endonuclease subunit S [Klebsiella pneumoniae]WPG85794.1 restriction endonuclease subunit S [Klebsiella pneumoniae]WPG91211.1 restriction endonuclease subunit S [Klebsiella pneumoniae]WPG96642.1 restriction endonuclease subunit S [Klebsiella pneumoniae]HEE1053508.1 restriction endonuclease subunit S [Klebsiella pneumoniae]